MPGIAPAFYEHEKESGTNENEQACDSKGARRWATANENVI